MNKKSLLLFLFGCLAVIGALFLCQYFLDPYGLQNTENKRIENLNSENNFLFIPKINRQSYYYLLGTSRTLRFDINQIKNQSGKDTLFLGISGSSISQWIFLIRKIKKNQKSHIILGLDPFSLNETYDAHNTKSKKVLSDAFNRNYVMSFFGVFLNADFISTIFSTSIRNRISNKDHFLTQQNLESNTETDLNKKPYQNFLITEQHKEELISQLDEKDIVILFPEYYLYYTFYAQEKSFNNPNSTILDEYLNFVAEIVTKTDAKVWSFMGINNLTLQENNFDQNFWHFKPKVAKKIIDDIFCKKECTPYGVLLTKSNLKQEISNIKNQIINVGKFK